MWRTDGWPCAGTYGGSDALLTESLTAAPLALGHTIPKDLEQRVVDAFVRHS